MNLVANDFSDIIVLTVTSFACLYVVCFLSKLIEKIAWINIVLSAIGRDSFYIMGLHFIGFKIGTVILHCFGIEMPLAELLPPVGSNGLMFLYYAVFGIGVPLAIVNIFRVVKNIIWKK